MYPAPDGRTPLGAKSRVRLTGTLPAWVSAKDVILEMLRRHGVSGGVGRVIEYHGPGLAQLSAMDRHVIANMGADLGATTTVFPADEQVRQFLTAQGRGDDFTELVADPDATYDLTEEIDLSGLRPLIARPGQRAWWNAATPSGRGIDWGHEEIQAEGLVRCSACLCRRTPRRRMLETMTNAHEHSAALASAATAAGYAPSIHNTQPWRWRVQGSILELYGEVTRQLANTDPSGRLLVVSAGAALHHVRVALAAEGWAVKVDRLPDPDEPTLLARLVVIGRTEVTPESMRLMQTIRVRHTDRRPVQDTPVAEATLEDIRYAVEAEHAWLHLLHADDVLDLAVTANRAQTLEKFDPQWQEEISYWAGASAPEGLGVPDTAIPAEPPQTTVPGRDFGHPGQLPVSAGHDRAARYAILYGSSDTPVDWLRGGEALSAAWLAAIGAGLSLVPMSAAVEVDSTRQLLRRLLSQLGEPYLVVRLGVPDQTTAGLPKTPRLPAEQTVEVV
jgi:nitroreductase